MATHTPNRSEVWALLKNEFDAKMVEGSHSHGDIIEVTHEDWTVYLETDQIPTGDTSITYTRMRAPFVSNDGLIFRIYKSSIFSSIGKILGMTDIKVGHDDFDDDFIIKGNDKSQISKLFDNKTLRDLIVKQPELSLEVKSTEGTQYDDRYMELYFEREGTIDDLEQLELLFQLFMELLDDLVKVGSASPIGPINKIYEDE